MDIKQLCFSLAEKNGTSGDEKAACEYAKQLLSEYMTAQTDVLGNVVGTMGNKGAHILLDAHIDQIGLVVRHIDDKGFLLVDKVGGPDLRVLIGAEVIVHGEVDLFGVISSVPPHLQKGDSKNESIDLKTMAVDIGMTKESAEKLVSIGDRITLRNQQLELLGDKIVSPSFDDRCCVAVILKALEMTKGKLNNITVSVLFSAQEETTGSGAKTGSFSLMPDYAIALDVGFGDDPYTDKTQTIALGKGPSIGISPTLDREFTKELKEICNEKNIPYQHDVMGGRTGTNADSINNTGRGIKTALVSVPLRYMHTGCEVISVCDIENAAKLLAEYLLKKEAECNA
ncbi:MAG: M20/M25/M40 family metallo-hydrolase [Clostridia bacterium]|nr:M20/M25/M40 family metallo-hydrolase [Clostridia bacterium]MBO7319817.1 M20/M25/M40 family metallo-hydrolase [Clostridia bacterium]